MINEVLFFSYGDANDASTWSNVPYLFSYTLEKRGVIVHRINIAPNRWIRVFYDKICFPIIGLFFPGHHHSFMRSVFFEHIVRRRIRIEITKICKVDLVIMTNFDFVNEYSIAPTVLFSDWTYEILINERNSRKPYFFEKRFITQQKRALANASLVISLFADCAESIRKSENLKNVLYLGSNVINSFYQGELNSQEIIANKLRHRRILFIGGRNYIDDARKVISAFNEFYKKNSDYELHLIGIEDNWINSSNKGITCYGYLRKDIYSDCQKYYELVKSARVVINPTEILGGYSSIIEAMYFYTPVIIYPYTDFVNEFGVVNEFGIYLKDLSELSIVESFNSMISSDRYREMCQIAHQKVSTYTWDNYIDRFLAALDVYVFNRV